MIRRKHKKIILIVSFSCTIIVIGIIMCYLTWSKKDELPESKLNSNIEIELPSAEVKADITNNSDNIQRYVSYSEISGIEYLTTDSMFDVRILFPNGEDYIVLKEKEAYELIEGRIKLRVSEVEIQKMSSAITDLIVYQGSKIYLSEYTGSIATSEADYPPNFDVIKRLEWSQNISDSLKLETDRSRRQALEENLTDFFGL